MRKFQYLKPSAMEEASEILACFGDSAVILNGGTDLLVRMRDNLVKPECVVDIKGLPGMKSMGYVKGQGFFIGGAVTMNELVMNTDAFRDYHILAQSAHEVGSFQLRNRAALGGNVCNASPSGDTLPALYVLEAMVKVYSAGGTKLIPIEEFILGVRKTALNRGEIVMGLMLPKLDGISNGAYYKHSRRKDVDLATVSAAAFCHENKWKVCFGAVAPTPVRGRKTEKILDSLETIDEEKLQPVLDAAVSEVCPIDDVRASKEYRAHMVRIALKRAVLKAYEELM